MINIKDIQDRLKNNPEPKEVTEIRSNIIKSFKDLRFEEGPHKYFRKIKKNEEIELPSVSSIIHKFEPYKDWDLQAEKSALSEGITVEEKKRMWHEKNLMGTNSGSVVHLYAENFINGILLNNPSYIDDVMKMQYEDGYLIPASPKQRAVANVLEEITKIPNLYPVMAEAKVYTGINDTLHLNQNYAGTFDMLFAFKRDDKYVLCIYDWKTNENIEKQYCRDNNITLTKPFNDMINEPKSVYTLQLSCYEMAIRQLGYDVVDRKLMWVKDDGTYEKISLKSEINKLSKIL